MREIASFEVVSQVANALVVDGAEPSIVAVQSRIGGGSYSTVKKHLAAWAEQRAKEAVAIPSEILAKAQEFGRAVWSMAATTAYQEVQKARELAQDEVAAIRNELAEATGVIGRLENIEAEQEVALDACHARLRETELALVEAQTTAAQVPKLEKALAEAQASAKDTYAELNKKATEVGKLAGEVEALRGQIREFMVALKK